MLIVVDDRTYRKYPKILDELYYAGIRLNRQPPDVSIEKRGYGGIDLGTTVRLTKLDKETIKGMMREMGFANASIVIRQNIDQDELLDVLEANRTYIPGITVINKSDVIDKGRREAIIKRVKPDIVISASKGTNIEALKQLVFKRLKLVRVFMKQPGKEPDLTEPLIMHEGVTVADVCLKLHRDMLKYFRYAKVWGSSRFPGQKLGSGYQLKDGDVLQLVLD